MAQCMRGPVLRGGMGSGLGPTKYEIMISEYLGWPMNVIVTTENGKRPYFYELDVADVSLKICVEADGNSHRCGDVKERDYNKNAFLRHHGWSVLRFTHAQLDRNFIGCMKLVEKEEARREKKYASAS